MLWRLLTSGLRCHLAISTGLLCHLAISTAHAQDAEADEAATETAAAESSDGLAPVIDPTPANLPRALAMGGALSTVADDIDAAFLNPAGIGGLQWGKRKVPWLRKLYFPSLGFSANKNATSVNSDFKSDGGAGDAAVGEAIVNAHAGEHQYGRASTVVGMVLGRMIFVPFNDVQLSAIAEEDDSGLIDTRYRSVSGLGTGMSLAGGGFSLGVFGYSMNISETTGLLSYQQIVDNDQRKEAVAENSTKYTATAINAGVTWELEKKWKPTIAIAQKHLGDTKLEPQDGGEAQTLESDLTVGLGISPSLGNWGVVNYVLEAGQLESSELSISQKIRTGIELLIGVSRGVGSYSAMAIRAGYNDAGASYGLALNIGLVSIEATSYAVDVAPDNNRVTEQRFSTLMNVNVADF